MFALHLRTPVRFLGPVPIHKRSGAVAWSKFEPADEAPLCQPRQPPATERAAVTAPPDLRGRDHPSTGVAGRPREAGLAAAPPTDALPSAAAAASDARAVATVAILRRHQDAIEVAMSTANHFPEALAGGRALVAELLRARRRSKASQCPFQQDGETGAVGTVAHNMRRRARARAHADPMTDTRTEPESERVWRHMLVAKYTELVDDGNTAIAHGVYVARVGRRQRTKLNNGVSVELLGWLDRVSGHAPPHHHAELSYMWRVLSQQGYDPNARVPEMCRAEPEIAAAILQWLRHAKDASRECATTTARARAAIAALQSTGHLVTAPLRLTTRTSPWRSARDGTQDPSPLLSSTTTGPTTL